MPVNPDIPSRVSCPCDMLVGAFPATPSPLCAACTGKVLFEKVAELVPRHPGRTKKAAAPTGIKQLPGLAGPSGSAAASKQGGKSGKKKRK